MGPMDRVNQTNPIIGEPHSTQVNAPPNSDPEASTVPELSRSKRTCGECTLCCKVLGVQEIDKPRNQWCPLVAKDHHSCTIHSSSSYPVACKNFTCLWLEREELPDYLRPDKIHAFFTSLVGESGLVINLDPGYPLAHLQYPLNDYVRRLIENKTKLLLMVGNKVHMNLGHKWFVCKQVRHPDGRVEAILPGAGSEPQIKIPL